MVPPADTGASATDYDYHGHKHPYHLVDPSPWPFIGSMSAFVMAIGAVLYMHEEISWVLILGFVGVLGTMKPNIRVFTILSFRSACATAWRFSSPRR